MKITKLILRNCDRFLLNQIREIVYTPQSPYQLITGNNGSGKSSLLEELSPLPPDKNKFTSNGYKEIHIVHEGRNYVLINDFTKGGSGHHSFKVNNEELNDGANVTTQLLLVKEHFKYTKEVHELVIGKKRFTSMSGLQRRDWFVKIANVDMTYIMNLFNNIKTAYRDNQGAVKLQEKRLASSLEQLVPKEEEEKLQKETDMYQGILNKLMSLIPREIKKVEDVEAQLQYLIDGIKVRYQTLNDLSHPYVKNERSLEGLKTCVHMKLAKVNELKDRFEKETQRHLELEQRYSKMHWDEDVNEAEMEAELNDIEARLPTLTKRIEFSGDITETIRIAEEIKQPFEEWCTSAITNTDGRFSSEKYERDCSRFREVEEKLNKVRGGVNRLEEHIHHVKSNLFETCCPHCHFKFQTSIDSQKLPEFEQRLVEGRQMIPDLEKQCQELKEEIDAYRAYRDNFLYCRRTFIAPYPSLAGFFDKLAGMNFRDTPLVAVGQLDKFILALEHTKQYRELNERRMFLKDVLAKRRGGEATLLKGLLNESDMTLSSIQGDLHLLTQEYRDAEVHYEEVKRYFDLLQELDAVIKEYEDVFRDLESTYEGFFLTEALAVYQAEYHRTHGYLAELKTKRRVVEDVENYLKDLKQREQEFKLLLDVLNPNDGLIAKTLLGFIHHFLDQFNQLIGHIWTYDMKVVAEESSEFTKNYNFPLKQANKDTPSQDVRDSSKGQQEMVDFAFILLTMRYLGLSHFPLLLDELGGGFTEVHRIHIFNYLKQLVETGQVEQLFLISHNVTSHDTLNLADVICFDPQATMVDEHVNKTIQFS